MRTDWPRVAPVCPHEDRAFQSLYLPTAPALPTTAGNCSRNSRGMPRSMQWIDWSRGAAAAAGCGLVEWQEPPQFAERLSQYDATIYHFGNSKFHRDLYRAFFGVLREQS